MTNYYFISTERNYSCPSPVAAVVSRIEFIDHVFKTASSALHTALVNKFNAYLTARKPPPFIPATEQVDPIMIPGRIPLGFKIAEGSSITISGAQGATTGTWTIFSAADNEALSCGLLVDADIDDGPPFVITFTWDPGCEPTAVTLTIEGKANPNWPGFPFQSPPAFLTETIVVPGAASSPYTVTIENMGNVEPLWIDITAQISASDAGSHSQSHWSRAFFIKPQGN